MPQFLLCIMLVPRMKISTKTGFAHFFEHLLFEGSANIERGEFNKIVESNGGVHNANTTQDRTYYYETFPSNKMAIGLWLESERLLHPVINQIGVDTQKEVVQEERRLRVDNAPYGRVAEENVQKTICQTSLSLDYYRFNGTSCKCHAGGF